MVVTEAYKQALTAFREQKWSMAADRFTTLYQARQTAELNRYLAASLYHDQQFLMAERIAAENDRAYLDERSWFDFRLTVALHNQQFLFARQWAELAVQSNWRQAALNQIKMAEQQATQTLGDTQAVIAKQFYHLGDVKLGEQQVRLRRAQQLPLATYLRGARFLLVDPFLHPLLKATVLEQLSKLSLATIVKLLWLDDQTYEIATNDLSGVTDYPAAQAALTYLNEQLAQDDPGLAQNTQQNLNLQLMLLYPFADRVMKYPTAWVDYLLGRRDFANLTSQAQNDLEDWQKRLTEHMKTLFSAINDEKPEN